MQQDAGGAGKRHVMGRARFGSAVCRAERFGPGNLVVGVRCVRGVRAAASSTTSETERAESVRSGTVTGSGGSMAGVSRAVDHVVPGKAVAGLGRRERPRRPREWPRRPGRCAHHRRRR